MADQNTLFPLVQKFLEHDMGTAAHTIESLPEEQAAAIFKSLPASLAVRLLKHLRISYAAALPKDADEVFLQELTSQLDPRLASSILMHLPADARERLTRHLSGRLKEQIGELLEYPQGSIGRIMTTDFLTFDKDTLAEEAIEKIRILAKKHFPLSYACVVAGQGGNAGAQSLAVVMRGIVMREIPQDKIFRLILKEGKLGAINGAVIGVVTALVAWIWYGNPYLGVVIGLGMLFNLIFAGFSGAAIPLLMKRLGFDPAQSSSIILTTVTDVMGFLAFLGFAVIFQHKLV